MMLLLNQKILIRFLNLGKKRVLVLLNLLWLPMKKEQILRIQPKIQSPILDGLRHFTIEPTFLSDMAKDEKSTGKKNREAPQIPHKGPNSKKKTQYSY